MNRTFAAGEVVPDVTHPLRGEITDEQENGAVQHHREQFLQALGVDSSTSFVRVGDRSLAESVSPCGDLRKRQAAARSGRLIEI